MTALALEIEARAQARGREASVSFVHREYQTTVHRDFNTLDGWLITNHIPGWGDWQLPIASRPVGICLALQSGCREGDDPTAVQKDAPYERSVQDS
jgi:hypothetical protein